MWADEVFGRDVVEEHLELCMEAGLEVSGINAEVMPGNGSINWSSWTSESADQMWISRWLLYRISEDYGVSATLHPKPVKGDWNGAGAHLGFPKSMRADGGMALIEDACKN